MKQQKLTEGNILLALLRFAVPVLFALFLQALYGAVDLIVVGKFAEVADQSGVATGSMFMNTPTMLIAGLAMGVTVYIGTAIGAGNGERAGRGIGNAICMFALLGAAFTAIMVIFAEPLARFMNAPDESFSQTVDYIRICGAGTVFILAYNVLGAIFRGIGDSRTPLMSVAIACVFNIFGDLFFVSVLHMGAAGAALATVMAQALSVILSIFIIRKNGLPFPFQPSYIRTEAAVIKKLLMLGIPVALQDVLVHLSFLFIQLVVNGMGVTASAAIGVGEKVCAFLMLVGSAFMQSMSAFVAQNNGAGQHERARKAVFYGMGCALVAGLVTASLALFAGSQLAAIFSNDAEVIAESHSYLKAYSIDCVLTPIFFCLVGYFNGCEHTVFVMAQGLIGAFCVRIPFVWFVSRMEGVTLFHIGLGTPASSAVQVILCIAAYRYFEKIQASQSQSTRCART